MLKVSAYQLIDDNSKKKASFPLKFSIRRQRLLLFVENVARKWSVQKKIANQFVDISPSTRLAAPYQMSINFTAHAFQQPSDLG